MIGEDQSEGNPTQFLLVVSPLSNGKKNTGLIEIFQRPDSAPNIQRGYLRFLSIKWRGLSANGSRVPTLRQVSDRQEMWQQADHFARLVHDNLDLRDSIYVANEGRQLIGCDRVSVAIKVEAVAAFKRSGTGFHREIVQNRSIAQFSWQLASYWQENRLWYDGLCGRPTSTA